MPTDVSDLESVLDKIKKELRRNKADKRRLSHDLAKSLLEIMEGEGAKLIEVGAGNANYFCAEIDGVEIAVSPFASHDGWWEKYSDGFRSLTEKRSCRWGIALFILPEKRGIWIEGKDYEAIVLRGRETVHGIDVERAERLGIGHSFSNSPEFLQLIKAGPKPRPSKLLIRRRST